MSTAYQQTSKVHKTRLQKEFVHLRNLNNFFPKIFPLKFLKIIFLQIYFTQEDVHRQNSMIHFCLNKNTAKF